MPEMGGHATVSNECCHMGRFMSHEKGSNKACRAVCRAQAGVVAQVGKVGAVRQAGQEGGGRRHGKGQCAAREGIVGWGVGGGEGLGVGVVMVGRRR